MDQERIDKLTEHLMARHNANTGHRIDSTLGHVAFGILEDPQAHVDALVEAGVLSPTTAYVEGLLVESGGYRVVPPQPKLCRHCGGQIEWTTFYPGLRVEHGWKHAVGMRQCQTVAEPEEVA